MATRIPVTVLTGFLGAGKTTLIRHVLGNASGRRIALVINEFGDLGVDGALVEGCGDSACGSGEIVELTNGCICCTVSEDFVPAMESILARDEQPDHIIVETSGLALPQPLVRAFNWPRLRNHLTVDGVIVVVDGKAVVEGRFANDPAAVDAQRRADTNLDHESPLAEVFEDQLVSADIIVVNKSDLLGPGDVDGLVARLRQESRKGTRVVAARNGDLPIDVVLGARAAVEDGIDSRQARHHHDDEEHDHDEFESFVVEFGPVTKPESLAARIVESVRQHDILRIKGFAAVTGRPMRLAVQAVGPRVEQYFDRPYRFGEERTTRLVVIGMAGLDRTGITTGLTAAAC